MRQKSKSRQGAALLAVVIVSMMMAIIIAAALSLVNHTRIRTNKEYRQKQAYFMATSCLEGFVSYYEIDVAKEEQALLTAGKDDELSALAEANIKKLQTIANSGKITNVQINSHGQPLYDEYDDEGHLVKAGIADRSLGTCTITVVPEGTTKMRVVSTAEYLGETKTVVAYLKYTQPSAKSKLNNALEFASTKDNSRMNLNNINVVGATESSNSDGTDLNLLYTLGSTNNNYYSGAMTVCGSLLVQNKFVLRNNLNYDADAARAAADAGQVYEESPGCVLNVTRSLHIGCNECNFLGDRVEKPKDDNWDCNYINVGEVLIANSSKFQIGGVSTSDSTSLAENLAHQVDVYSGLLIYGNNSLITSEKWNNIVTSMTDGITDSGALTYYKDNMKPSDNGSNPKIYGNIYTYKVDDVVNGDIYIDGQLEDLYGNIYCAGKITINGSDAKYNGFLANLYDRGYHIYVQDPPMNYDQLTSGTKGAYYTDTSKAQSGALNKIFNTDSSKNLFQPLPSTWSATENTGREKKPTLTTNPSKRPYQYYPEDLLLRDGVSTISDIYKAFYKKDNTGKYTLDLDVSRFYDTYDGSMKDDHTTVADAKVDYSYWTDSTKSNSKKWAYSYEGKYTYLNDPTHFYSGQWYKTADYYDSVTGYTLPDVLYYIKDSFVWGNEHISNVDSSGSFNVLIDVDAAGKDIVVLMKDGGYSGASPHFFIKNNTDDHYVYFVSDSGVGNLDASYDPTATTDKGYTANDGSWRSNGTDSDGNRIGSQFSISAENQFTIVDLTTYAKSQQGNLINFTYKNIEKEGDTPVYNAGKSKIIFLITEDSTLRFPSNNNFVQATIYGPESTILLGMPLNYLNLVNDIVTRTNTNSSQMSVAGSVICGQFEQQGSTTGNNVTIVYQEVDDNSMLSKVKGGKSKLTASFRVVNYASY